MPLRPCIPHDHVTPFSLALTPSLAERNSPSPRFVTPSSMKTKTLAAALLLACTLSLHAADKKPEPKLTANSVTADANTMTFRGNAILTLGDKRITAAEMTYDRATGILTSVGETKIESPAMPGTMTATDVVINTQDTSMVIKSGYLRYEKYQPALSAPAAEPRR